MENTQEKEKIKDFDAIIYHGPCPDGTGGLWSACHYKPIKNRYACKAGCNPIGNYTDMNVIFVDLCPQIDYLLELLKVAKYVVILDHHKSSEQMIKDNAAILSIQTNLHIEFDMGRSGCQMSWDYFFDNAPRPFFIDYMGDRDLWTWKLPSSREINTALWELGYIDSYDLTKLTELLVNSEEKKSYLESSGRFIEAGNKREVDIGVSNAIEATMEWRDKTFRVWLGGNINPSLRSELGNVLCSKQFKDGVLPDFSVCWQYDPKSDEWWLSFRGVKDRSPDLSEIASSFGGGGHPLASGITIKPPSKGLKEIFIY
jgi:oligoribonuclease NrnB/cAMP/cGMP phosphodiesterase (DHH superfamily)